MSARDAAIGDIWRSPELGRDFRRLTSFGGRLVGSDGEAAAREWLRERASAARPARVGEHVFAYEGWTNETHRLELRAAPGRALPCHPLLRCGDTPAAGIDAEVIDLGRGAPADFAAAGDEIGGRIVLARHEYPFAAGSIHRRRKYAASLERGAVGFLIANDLAGEMPVAGSCGRDGPDNIPGLGVSFETGALLAGGEGRPGVRMTVRNRRAPAQAANIVAEIPGRGAEWVVVSAHYDGHDLAQSALDNATGVAAALQILRSFAPHVGALRRGLRVILFTAEESALLGSRLYVDSLAEDELRAIAAVVNLDTLAGSPRLACLTSGFAELDEFVRAVDAEVGIGLRPIRPIARNSDHFNFARRGVPALRLIAGFDEPDAGARYLLTSGDTADKVAMGELKLATLAAAELAWAALDRPGPIAAHKSSDEMAALIEAGA